LAQGQGFEKYTNNTDRVIRCQTNQESFKTKTRVYMVTDEMNGDLSKVSGPAADKALKLVGD